MLQQSRCGQQTESHRDHRPGVRRAGARGACGRGRLRRRRVRRRRVARSTLLRAGSSYVEDVSSRPSGSRARQRAVPADAPTRRHSPASTSPSSRSRRRCATARPTSSFVEAAGRARGAATCGPAPASSSRAPRTPGRPKSCWHRCWRPSRGCAPGADFQLGYSPERIDPGNTTWTLTTTPKVVSGIDDASLERVQGFYDALVDETVAGVGHPRGRAHEAAREHVPSRQHRARQRARGVRRTTSGSTSGRRSGPPRRSPSDISASLPGPGSAVTACPSTRRISRGRSNAARATASGSSSSRTRSTRECPTTSSVGSPTGSRDVKCSCTGRVCCSSDWRSSRTPQMPVSRPHSGSHSASSPRAPRCAPSTPTSCRSSSTSPGSASSSSS